MNLSQINRRIIAYKTLLGKDFKVSRGKDPSVLNQKEQPGQFPLNPKTTRTLARSKSLHASHS